ncbi:MAG TPA: PAS domain S-box protein [Spongiibacteraceae bacterium]|nr:PAS domain S-box protein [Spongiibacteraceae bacterium]
MSTNTRLASLARRPPWWVTILAAASVSYVASVLTILLRVEGGPGHVKTIIWPPTAFAFVLIWYYGRPAILGSALGTFLFVFQFNGHPVSSLLSAAANVLPMAYATWQLRRLGVNDAFATPRDVMFFALIAVLIAPMLNASLLLLIPLLDTGTAIHWQLAAWLALWANGAIANAIFTPAILRLSDWRVISRNKLLEVLGLVIAGLIFWWTLFLPNPQLMAQPLTIFTAPFLLLMAFRFNFGIVAGFSVFHIMLTLLSLARQPYETTQDAFFLTIEYLGMLGFSNLAVGAGLAAVRSAFRQVSESEELLRGMFEQAGVGLLLYDLKKKMHTFNPTFCKMLGYSNQEVAHVDLRSLSLPEEQDVTSEMGYKLRSGEVESFNQERRLLCRDGGTIWTSLTMTLLRDKYGNDSFLIGVFEDITARKVVEAKLRDSEQRFRITFEQAAVGVVLLDRDVQWLQINQKFCDIVGYTRQELLRIPYSKLIAPEDEQITAEAVAEITNGNSSQVQVDHRYMRKNGDIIWVNSLFSVTRDA